MTDNEIHDAKEAATEAERNRILRHIKERVTALVLENFSQNRAVAAELRELHRWIREGS